MCKAGEVVGWVSSNEYLNVRVDGLCYLVHRVIWLIVHGEWPKHTLDHINGNTVDNRISNLRDVPHIENCRNTKKRSDNTSGVLGVRWHKRDRKWAANITVSGKLIHIGNFDCKDRATMARWFAEEKHEFHENHGRK